MDHVVELITVESRPTAVVEARTTWQEFPVLWKGMLDEVWDLVMEPGAEVVYSESPMQHSIDPNFVAGLRPWLRQAVERGGVAARDG